MARLVNTNPELFNNPTLGEASPLRFLDEMEKQKREDRNARLERREPRTVRRVVRYPSFKPSGSVSSGIKDEVAFVDDNDLPTGDNEFNLGIDDPMDEV